MKKRLSNHCEIFFSIFQCSPQWNPIELCSLIANKARRNNGFKLNICREWECRLIRQISFKTIDKLPQCSKPLFSDSHSLKAWVRISDLLHWFQCKYGLFPRDPVAGIDKHHKKEAFTPAQYSAKGPPHEPIPTEVVYRNTLRYCSLFFDT